MLTAFGHHQKPLVPVVFATNNITCSMQTKYDGYIRGDETTHHEDPLCADLEHALP